MGAAWVIVGRFPVGELLHFAMVGDHAEYRPTGQVSLEDGVRLVKEALTCARAQGVRRLLVDLTGLTGVAPPALGERYFFIREWGVAAGGMVALALVARPELLDRERFGDTVATNVGMRGRAFASEAEALAWLAGQ